MGSHQFKDIRVAINISAIQLLREGFVGKLFSTIYEMGVCPNNISLEITESVFASNFDRINEVIGKLKDLGLHISIDDFGTGYSSLARGGELNANYFKIDKHFIDKLLIGDTSKAITGDIISMAHKLGYDVVAEGVEDETQLDYLREYGCDKIQGYLISGPLDEEFAMEFLKEMNKDKDVF